MIFVFLLCKLEELASAYILAVKSHGMECVRALANCAPWLSVSRVLCWRWSSHRAVVLLLPASSSGIISYLRAVSTSSFESSSLATGIEYSVSTFMNGYLHAKTFNKLYECIWKKRIEIEQSIILMEKVHKY